MEERADDVRVLLETAHVPPARVDLARAVAAGRRVRRRRRYAGVAAATVLAVAGAAVTGRALATRDGELVAPVGGPVPPTATPAPFAACSVRSLPVPRKDAVVRTVVADPTGRYAVSGLMTTDGRTLPVLWSDGEPQILKVPGQWVEPLAVNSSGVVVGSAEADGQPYAWVYRDGAVVKLPGLGGGGASAHAVNARGDVAGMAWRSDSSVAVVWPAGGADTAEPRRGGKAGQAWGIADDGTVVGTIDGGTPYVWGPDGAGRALPLPRSAISGHVTAVRGQWAAGWVREPSQARPYSTPAESAIIEQKVRAVVPARWNLATGQVTTWPGREAPALAVNASGWTLLSAPAAEGATAGRPEVAAPDGGTVPVSGATDARPLTISDDAGRLYGVRTPTGVVSKFQAPASGAIEVTGDPTSRELLTWTC